MLTNNVPTEYSFDRFGHALETMPTNCSNVYTRWPMLYHLVMKKNKLVSGIGIYDKGLYPASIMKVTTKEYAIWSSMLNRCGGHEQRPSYIGCSVHPDFIKFQDFAEWCQHQIGFDKLDWQLDKDILIQGNKVYGPDTCCFVPRQLNMSLAYNKKTGGMYPLGVSKMRNTYKASVASNGKRIHLGSYDTPEAAHEAYKVAKIDEIHRQATIYKDAIDPRAYAALMDYSFE